MAKAATVAELTRVRQIRQYAPDPVPADVVAQILDAARWTGSSRNEQPWRFIVVTDKERLSRIAQLRPNINWAAHAPLGVAIVLPSDSTSDAYDEGRVTERILIAARLLGYGGGVAWYGEAEHQAEAKRVLGIPQDRTARQIVMLGRATSAKDPRPNPRPGGRKPLDELVSYEHWDGRKD